MTDYAALRRWSTEKKVYRLGKIRTQIEKKLAGTKPADDAILGLLDEAIVIFLEILSLVKAEKKLTESGFSILEYTFRGEEDFISTCLRRRVIATMELLKRFSKAHVAEKKRLRPQLVVRGLI